jgi:hypothetical protein
MMTPVYLAILTVYHPRVNLPVLRATSLVGVVVGLGNMWFEIVLKPVYWWMGVLHIPLLSISSYGLVLSFKTERAA